MHVLVVPNLGSVATNRSNKHLQFQMNLASLNIQTKTVPNVKRDYLILFTHQKELLC